MAPKDVHRLIPGTWEYVTLLGKRNFSDEIKVMGLEMGHCFELVEWMKSDHKTLKSREARETHREQGSAPTAGLEKGGVCREPGVENWEWPQEGGDGLLVTASMKLGTWVPQSQDTEFCHQPTYPQKPRRPGNGFSLELPAKKAGCGHLGCSPVGPLADSWPTELWDDGFVLF